MPQSVSMQECAEKAKNGMYKAQKAYEEWSGGLWAWQAPEYLLTIYIAQELHRIRDRPLYLTLEQHVGQALHEAGANKQVVEEAGKQKFDIMVWWGGSPYLPRGIIEVKKQVSSFSGDKEGQGGIKKDADRIITSLNATDRLQFGILAYYTSCTFGIKPRMSAKERIQERLDEIASDARQFIQDRGMKFERLKGKIRTIKDPAVGVGPNDHAWVAEVLRIWKLKK